VTKNQRRPTYAVRGRPGDIQFQLGLLRDASRVGRFTVVTGTRVLEDTEFASVLSAYDNLAIGASAPCDALTTPTSYRAAWVQIDDGPTHRRERLMFR